MPNGLGFQIRGETHPLGGLWITSELDGGLVLETEEGTVVELGDAEHAHLIAKCIEVSARWETSEEFREASEAALERTLEQIKADHRNVKTHE